MPFPPLTYLRDVLEGQMRDHKKESPCKVNDIQQAGHEMTQFETAGLFCHPFFISLPFSYTSPIQYFKLCNGPFHTLHRSVMPC